MRTNIEIDDELMARAMEAGPYSTKKEAVEAGLKLLRRQAHYREILKWEGKLRWEGDESVDWTAGQPEPVAAVAVAAEPQPAPYRSAPARRAARAEAAPTSTARKSARAGR